MHLVSGNNNIFIGYSTQPNISTGSSNQLNIGNWIYGNNGNIGIGVANPTSKLDVAGNIKTNAFTFDGNDDSWLRLRDGDNGAYKDFAVNQLWTNNNAYVMGNVGIGTNAPTQKLDVNGNIRFNDVLSTPGRMHITGGEYLYMLNTNGAIVSKAWGGNGNMNIEGDSITAGDIISYGDTNKWIFHTPDDGRTMMYIAPEITGAWAWGNSMRLASNGNVGIGGIDPTVKLDVNGTIRIRGGSPADGKVLMSDADGNARWDTPTTG